MNGDIEFKDLRKHIPNIFSTTNLHNITVEQMKSIALLMENAYQKGKNENNERKNSITNCTVNVKVDCDIENIKEKISGAILGSLSVKKHSGPCVSATADGPCEKCGK